jgi:NADH-quinone oxidoreductase subunit L
VLDLLWVVPAAPLAGFLVLALAGPRLARAAVGTIGMASIGVATLAAFAAAAGLLALPPDARHVTQVLWTWIDVDGFTPRVALYLDAVSLVMIDLDHFKVFNDNHGHPLGDYRPCQQ